MGKGLGTSVGLAMLDALYKRDTYTYLWSIQAYRIGMNIISLFTVMATLKVPFTLAELSGKQALLVSFFP